MSELSQLVQQKNYEAIIELVPRIRNLDYDAPPSIEFHEARALFHTGYHLYAQERLVAYLNRTGRTGRYYDQAKDLLIKVREGAQAQEQEQLAKTQE